MFVIRFSQLLLAGTRQPILPTVSSLNSDLRACSLADKSSGMAGNRIDEAAEAIRVLIAGQGRDRTLKYYCGVGRVVCSLPGDYRNKSIEILEARLAALGLKGLKASNLRKMEKFVQT